MESSIPCIVANLLGWVVVDGIDSRYRLAAHPLPIPDVEQSLSQSGLNFGVNRGAIRSYSHLSYGISLLSAFYSISVSSSLLNLPGER
jgi:hypothetical protein